MNLKELYSKYALNDGKILSFGIDYDTNQIAIKLSVRRHIDKEKFEACIINLEFKEIVEVDLLEDFETRGQFSDITLLTLENKTYYFSIDPYGNTGLPHDKDNFVIKSKRLAIVDEIGKRNELNI